MFEELMGSEAIVSARATAVIPGRRVKFAGRKCGKIGCKGFT
jgi:hypothetical protein